MQDEFQPYPKNPIIQRFFSNIGRTATIGSGVINLYKYTPFFPMVESLSCLKTMFLRLLFI